MRFFTSKTSRLITGFSALALLLTANASHAQTVQVPTVNLTAAPTSTTLPDGQSVPMWGYTCTGTDTTSGVKCTAANSAVQTAGTGWSPIVITVPYVGTATASSTNLTINLTNNLSFAGGKIPTSLTIVGQLGGGLGGGGSVSASPVHIGGGVTWPTADPVTTSTPPAQMPRVQSFGTEVTAGATTALTWSNLRPGTYLIESGTHPSIQAPMGLYGILVVTTPVNGTTPGQAYPTVSTLPVTALAVSQFDADLPLVLSEIDPVQNASVALAVGTAGFSETAVWSGLPGKCGSPSNADGTANTGFNTCYPPAVNYSPRYYLVNGVSFDRTNIAAATANLLAPIAPATIASATSGNVVLHLVNAGLRMHVPSIVNAPMTLIAEDGNPLPGQPRIQNEVFLAAGKTYDVAIHPTQASGAYSASTLAFFDRQLSLSTNNQRDGGMQAYIAVAGGAATGVGSTNALNGSGVALTGGVAKTFYCVSGMTLSVTDPAGGLLGGTTGANGVVVTAGLPGLTVQSNGTFTYVPPASGACGGDFTYLINNSQSVKSTIAQCDANSSSAPGCTLSGKAKLVDDSFTGTNAKVLAINPPGVLLNDINPDGRPLSVDPATVSKGGLTSLTVGADGSLTAVAPHAGTYTFTYNVTNSQHTTGIAPATVTLNFPQGSGLKVNLVDQKHPTDPTWDIADATKKGDYRWIIEEDRTFWIDPKCQVNSATRPKDSYGRACPPTPVEALGYNFHSAGMPVVATGCVGSVSCESGQTVLGAPAVCDVGDGTCRTSDAAGNALPTTATRMELTPDQVYLDPNKHYFISIMPGDGINPTVNGAGGPVQVNATCDSTKTTCAMRQFDPTQDCPSASDFAPGTGKCGHNMGGKQIAPQFLADGTANPPSVTISLIETPLPSAKIAVLVYEDDYPLNGENDAGGGVDVLAPNEAGLGGFQVVLFDQAGGLGDSTGQITFDMFNMPVSNSLAGTPDPNNNGIDACPLTTNPDGIVGMIITCPRYEADNKTLSPLAGQAVIANLYPGLYEPQAFPNADRIARGEEWLQTNTLDGGKPHEAFVRPGEPAYFQEFGPGGFHVQIGFANPKIINDRRHNAAGTGICDAVIKDSSGNVTGGGGGLVCNSTITGQVHGNHMSRTPDERTYDTGSYDAFAFSSCYVSLGVPDAQDFAFAKCDADGNYSLTGLPEGTYKLAVFDQWNDIMLDGLITSVAVKGNTNLNPTVTQWRTNLYTRTYLDVNGNGIPDRDSSGNDLEPGAPLIPIHIRYRDGSVGFANTTDLNGYATYNEVFPFMNWLVVEPDQTRYKPTGQHIIYDAGGLDDCTTGAFECSNTAAHLAGTKELNSLPLALRVPGAVYCTDADCTDPAESILKGAYYTKNVDTSKNKATNTGLSSGRIDPPWHSEAWQGLLGQHSFIDFGMKPFAAHENGGIQGLVVYASTRPFDDVSLDVQLVWEPGVPNVQINLYQEGTAPDGSTTLTLVDTTQTTSWDKWAQGFQTDGHGNLRKLADGSYVPNMNCPGQDPTSGFFATLQGSKMWLDTADSTGNKKKLAYNSQFKCFDGWSQLNQIVPAPYDGKYTFPSTVELDPVTGRPAGLGSLAGVATPLPGTNCKICVANPDDGTPMLPAGKYVVEAVMPAGYEIVKEEDKNILMGDIYIAPVSQQFAGLGNVFILPDQAAINAYYNANNPLNSTTNLGVLNPREDFATTDQMWPCVGTTRIVPDTMSLFPAVGQTAPFAGASRPLCDRKEVSLTDQMGVSARFYTFTKNHIAGHFVGGMTNDMASEFDPFSPQFGEKFGVPNLPIRMRDFMGDEVTRIYGDQWGAYNGMFFSSWEVNPPNPTGYAPQMSVACMNDPGPILDTDPTSPTNGQMITDPAYNPAYSNFCYETPFMPGFTAYMDTPVTPVQAFADHYNLPDAEYPDGTPVIKRVDGDGTGPWVAGIKGAVVSIKLANGGSGYASAPTVSFTGGGTGATATANLVSTVKSVTVTKGGSGYTGTPTVVFTGGGGSGATGTAIMTGTKNKVVGSVTITNPGSGYTSAPSVSFTGGAGSGATATAAMSGSVSSVTLTNGGSGYPSATVTFTGGSGSGALATATVEAAGALKITAFGDRTVQNPQFAGPSATTSPYNAKTITRHYGFGAQPSTCPTTGSCPNVTVGGVALTNVTWTDLSITGSLAAGVPPCAQQQLGQSSASCGELVITASNGKQSIDAITVTLGGKAPTVVTQASPSTTLFGEFYANPLQTAIDNATPGDLLIVDTGSYRENLILWKPLRLQGVGAGSVTVNADAQPAGKMDAWRRRVSCLFGLTIQGVPNPGNKGYDTTGQFSCPASMYFRADRIPFEGFVGWDAASNGNLAQVLQEPSLMGAYEGAGITVVGRGVNQSLSAAPADLWGQGGGSGIYPDGTRYLNNTTDCQTSGAASNVGDYTTSNFLCNPSSIDGLSIQNSSQGGGGIFLHGWSHNLQIANNRISANAGTLAGGINLGTGEVPDAFTLDNTVCGTTATTPAPLCPPVPQGTVLNQAVPFQFNVNVHVHHNQIMDNASIGDALFSGTPTGGGGITVSSGSDYYQIDHNWIAANLTSGDGGGVAQVGLSFGGKINNNYVLFNQANNPTLPVDGGGIIITGAQADRTFTNGTECGNTSQDLDCPPGMGDGAGPNLQIDSNLILGNSAEDGSGGGLRLRQTNGTEVAAFLGDSTKWYGITVTNNIIANNVAGWDGAGVSLQDSMKTVFVNNTVASNDTTASAGVLFKTLAAINGSSPPPGCIPQPDPTLPQDASCMSQSADHYQQPAGLVTMQNTPNMMAQFSGPVVCPAGYGYGDAADTTASLTNGRCLLVSLPQIANDLFWQNRSFHVEITAMGTGNTSNQAIVTLEPTLNQAYTGQCMAPSSATPASSAPFYWDVGVRMDTWMSGTQPARNLYFNQATVGTIYGTTPGAIPSGDVGQIALTARNSILSDTANASNVNSVTGFPNRVPSATTVGLVGQYCNGARIPPEQCSTGQGANSPGMCMGYFTPAGQSETVGVSPVFTFNNIQASATVDEGNNWINMTYGPLTLSRPPAGTAGSTPSAELTVASAAVGVVQGAYSITAGSAAVGGGTRNVTGVPTLDFYGQKRPTTTISIGAVELVAQAPKLTSIAPNTGARGYVVPVTLTGTNLTGATAVNVSGTGVTVSAMTVVSDTTVTATFTIATGNTANLGARNVTVTTSAGTSNAVTFTVTVPPAPTLASIAPTLGLRGTSVPVTLTGTGLTNATAVNVSGNGVTASGITVVNDTTVTATFTITGTAALSARTVTVTTAGGTSVVGPATFTVTGPSLTSIAPTSGLRGTSVPVTLTGIGLTGATAVTVSGTGVTVSGLTVVNATTVTATFTITTGATLSTRTVTVTTPGGATNTVPFTVTGPTLTSTAPNTGVRGTVVPVTLTGTGLTGTTAGTVSGTGVTVSGLTVVNDTTVTATFNITTGATLSTRTVSVTTPGGTSTTVPFTVQGATLASITPIAGTHNTTVAVTLTGTNLTGATGVTVSGTGVTATGVTVGNGGTTVTANFAITNGAARNSRNVSVVTPIGNTNNVTFTVN